MNRKKWLIILWLGLMLVVFLQLIITNLFKSETYSLYDIIMSLSGGFITGVSLLFFLLIPGYDFSSKFSKFNRVVFLIVFAFIYSFIYILVLFLIPMLFKNIGPTTYISYTTDYASTDFHNVIKNYIFQIAVLFAFDYFDKETTLLTQKKDLIIELNKTKLNILKSQIQPHFLFNSLNSIVSVIDENKSNAQEMIVKLSYLLRTSLNADFENFSTLGEELNFIENYLNIEKMRFEDQLDFKIKISEKSKKIKLPPLILQPVIENAIIHGFKGLKNKLLIIIRVDEVNKIIYIENNGTPLNPREASPHTGLKNVVERLKIFYGDKDNFKIYQRGDYVVNEVILT